MKNANGRPVRKEMCCLKSIFRRRIDYDFYEASVLNVNRELDDECLRFYKSNGALNFELDIEIFTSLIG
jgi:hypothetical protein